MAKDRQYGKNLGDIRRDHVERYEFAASQVYGEVLDAACGCGYGSSILAKAAREVRGIDIEPEAIAWAKENFPGPNYFVADLTKTPWTGLYNWVVSFETLEHLDDPLPVLKQFRMISSHLIASVPNENVTPFRAENFAGDDYPHKRHYTPQEFDELLYNAGWTVLERHSQAGKQGGMQDNTDGMFLVYIAR